MTLPTIPDLPQQPAPTLDQQLTHAGLLLRVAEYQQRERMLQATTANSELMQQLLDQPPAPAAPAPVSGEGLTAGDVQIVRGLADAIRPQAAPQP